jgi:hypothetical protein
MPLAETWNGTTWAMLTVPAPTGATTIQLTAVSCTSADACTAIGGYQTQTSGGGLPLAERWNGTAWTVQAVPIPASGTGFALTGVSCTSATACTTVGNGHRGGAKPTSMLAEAWNGTAWTIQPTPRASASHVLGARAVSCTYRCGWHWDR